MQKAIKILHEDDCLIVFYKPAGLLVIPSPKKKDNTLVDIVNKQYGSAGEGKLHPCHRLDRDTSGVIVFAKKKVNQQLMMKTFQDLSVKKKYVAFVKGTPFKKSGEINRPIKDFFQKKYSSNAGTKAAVTKYKVVDVKKEFSVVDVWPLTGRTNQIRIHFSGIGHPVLGERVYAFRKDFNVDFRRLALHAGEVSFIHPVSSRKVEIKAELPDDMVRFLEKNAQGI